MIKMKLKKKRFYNPHNPNFIECSHIQLKHDRQNVSDVIQRRYKKRTFLQPLISTKKVSPDQHALEVKQIAEYILRMKRQGLRYTIQPEE